MKDNEGWAPERLKPLLTGIQELVPWLKQWYNEYDPEYATHMGDYFASFVTDEARALGFTLADLRVWRPTATVRNRGKAGRPAARELSPGLRWRWQNADAIIMPSY